MSISVNDKNLGHATAYAYAVAGGYEGTEADFTELLGNIATDLSEIENLTVSVSTLPAGSSATASYSNGVLSLGIPKGDTGATPNFSIGTVSTLPAGDNATASITGTAESPILNLGIPAGQSGDANNLAADYSSIKTYAVGDYCIYNGSLYRCTTAITTAEAWTAAHWTAVSIGGELVEIKSDVGAVEKTAVNDLVKSTLYRRSGLTLGIINVDGTVSSSSSAGYTPPFPVHQGDIVTVKRCYIRSNGTLSDEVAGKLGSIVYLAADGETYINAGYSWNANKSSITVSANRHYMQITIPEIMSGTYNVAFVYVTTPNGDVKRYLLENPIENGLRFKGDMDANTVYHTPDFVSVNNTVLTFTGHFQGTFGTLKFGGFAIPIDTASIQKPYIEVTDTQIKMYSDTDSAFDRTYDHGLTIANDIQVIIRNRPDSLYADVTLRSDGEEWKSTANTMRMGTFYSGIGAVSTIAMTDCAMSYGIIDIAQPVWVCGDSWATYYDSRWYYYALQDNLKFLKSGYAGQPSASALTRLKTLLSVKIPRVIVWMLGMNDPDTNDSTPNASWLSCIEELKNLCADRSITLILATVPTTATINNNAKNAYVISSGYRYVDQAKAMGADTSGNWITGYKSADGGHTSVKGAKMLYGRVLCDAPEIAICD